MERTQSTGTTDPTPDTNRELIRRLFEAMSRGADEEAAAFWAPDAVNYGSGRAGQAGSAASRAAFRHVPHGREGIRRVQESLRAAFPDRQYQLEAMVAEADMVACRVRVTGTFGTMPQLPVDGTSLITKPPTGKPYEVQHIHIFRIAGGQIAEHWAARDDLGLLVQLGAITVPAAAGGGHEG